MFMTLVVLAFMYPSAPPATSRASVRLELELAIAGPTKPDYLQPVSWADGRQFLADNIGKPVLCRVGDYACTSVCPALRPDVPTVHVASIDDDSTPRLRLIVQDKDGSLWNVREWRGQPPTEAEARSAAKDALPAVERAKRMPAGPGPSIAVPTPLCPNGRCPIR